MSNLIITLADVVLLVVLCLFAFWGWRKGAVRMGFSLVSLLAAIVLGKILYPVIADFLRNTPVYTGILSTVQKHTVSGEAETTGVIADLMAKGGEALSGILSTYLAELALRAIAFLLVVVVVKVLLTLASRLLKLFTSLPIIGMVNRMAGLVLGIVEGILIVTVLLAGIYVISPLKKTPVIDREIEKSIVVREWYLNNPLVQWASPDSESESK